MINVHVLSVLVGVEKYFLIPVFERVTLYSPVCTNDGFLLANQICNKLKLLCRYHHSKRK